MNMTQITASPTRKREVESLPPLAPKPLIRAVVAMISTAPADVQGSLLFRLFVELKHAGVDVELMGCVLAEVD
jgi:hypothetical protein